MAEIGANAEILVATLEISGRIEALNLREGDFVLVGLDYELENYQRARIRAELGLIFPRHVIIVLGKGETIKPIRPPDSKDQYWLPR